jgi:hypothetical protein
MAGHAQSGLDQVIGGNRERARGKCWVGSLILGSGVTMMEKNGPGVDGNGELWLQLMYRLITSYSGPRSRQ